jgi:hypothetical protein
VLGHDLSPERLDDAVVVPLTSPPGPWRKLPPKIARALGSFIERNRPVLLAYWDARISTSEMLDRLVAPYYVDRAGCSTEAPLCRDRTGCYEPEPHAASSLLR